MKHTLLLFYLLLISVTAIAQRDTIQLVRKHGIDRYYLGAKEIFPYKSNSILKDYPESNSDYTKLQFIRQRNTVLFFSALVLGFSGISIAKHNPGIGYSMAGAGIGLELFLVLDIPKTKKLLNNSITEYNKRVLLEK